MNNLLINFSVNTEKTVFIISFLKVIKNIYTSNNMNISIYVYENIKN